MKEKNLFNKTKEITRLNTYIKISYINMILLFLLGVLVVYLSAYGENKYKDWVNFKVEKEKVEQGEMKIIKERIASGISTKIVKSDDYKTPYMRVTPDSEKKKNELYNKYESVRKIYVPLVIIMIFQISLHLFLFWTSFAYIFKISYSLNPITIKPEIGDENIELVCDKGKKSMTIKLNDKIISENHKIFSYFKRERFFSYTIDNENTMGVVITVPFILPSINPINIDILHNGNKIEKIIC